MLRRIASLVAILLLLLTAAPVMACVTDPGRMQAGNACCQTMHGKCGDMEKTGCCRIEVRDPEPQFAAHASVVPLPLALIVVYFDLALPQVGLPARWMAPDEHSPPIPRSARPTILRL